MACTAPNSQMLTQRDLHLQYFGDLFLGEHIDLEIQVVPHVASARLPILLHKHKGGKQNGFAGNHEAEQDIRVGIKRARKVKGPGIQQKPEGEPDEMDYDKT